jgi:bifunctional non-homologous end joining protein LigD
VPPRGECPKAKGAPRSRLYTRRGYDWSDRYPRIEEALRQIKVTSAVIDGEAVWCGADGTSDFDKLHARAHDHQVIPIAFDLLEPGRTR